MKALITGGAGYVGSHVQALFLQQGVTCLTYDNFSTGHKEALAEDTWVYGDITDPQALDDVFSDFQPDAVIHLAALATQGECCRRPEDCRRINVEGTRNVLETMRRHRVKRMVFASSCAVYESSAAAVPLKESDPLGASAPYGASKLAVEQLLPEYGRQYGIRSVIFRLFNVAGADPEGRIGERHNPETHLLPLAITTALGLQEKLDVYGDDYPTPDGTAVRDYIHVWDVAGAFMLAMRYLMREDDSQVLNLGSGRPVSVNQLLEAVSHITGKALPVAVKPRREGDASWLLADMARTKAILDWQPECSSLDSIIRTALRWHRKV